MNTLLPLVLTVLATLPAAASEVSLRERALWQQDFVASQLKTDPPDLPVRAPEAMDALLARLDRAWREHGVSDDPTFLRFDPYVYYWTFRMVSPGSDDGLECHIWSEYMVPAFLADYERYSTNVSDENVYLIRRGSLDNLFGMSPFRCELAAGRWDPFWAAHQALPEVLRRYSSGRTYADESVMETLEVARRIVEATGPSLAVLDALRSGNRDTAFAGLAAAWAAGDSPARLVPLARRLAEAYRRAAEPDRALAALDLLTRSTTAGDLPEQEIAALYAAVDPERGPRRLTQVLRMGGRSALAPSEERIELAGNYLDLRTGEPLDLADLQGRLVLIDFWASWCRPCLADFPRLNALVDAYDPEDLTIIGISSDPLSGGGDAVAVGEFVEAHGMRFAALFDDPERSLTRRFEVNGWPSRFLIDGKGRLLRHPTDAARRTVEIEEVELYLTQRGVEPRRHAGTD